MQLQAANVDWLGLWRDLVTAISRSRRAESPGSYEARVRKKASERPDPLLDFLLRDIDAKSTVLDVGAGNGRWTIPAARVASRVTAVEPSDAMVRVLRENVAASGLDNVEILQSPWEEATVGRHDLVTSSHAIYFSPDFASFVRKMSSCARKRCYLAARLPPHDGIIGELSLRIYGHPHDSPNAVIAYNALYSLGIYANVLVEHGIHRWMDATLKDAFARAKRHLRLEAVDSYDELIRDTLARRLAHAEGSHVWPDGMRSVLLWWDPSAGAG